jgi:surface carbohydrate biosynthesis protein
MKLKSLPEAIKYVWRAKLRWGKPQHTEILIYDRQGSEDLYEYFQGRTVGIFDCRGETINIRVLLSVLVKYGSKSNFQKYAELYVACVAPAVVVTFIDNTITFYQLKEYNPSVKFLSIQNGWRDDCLFETLSEDSGNHGNLKADAILCFGSAIGRKYAKHIKSAIYPIGSFKNNKRIKDIKSVRPNTLLFISQFRPPVIHNGEYTMPVGQKHIPWDDFYFTEKLLLPLLLKYTQLYGFKLEICGTSFNDSGVEKTYFESILGVSGWEYLPKHGDLDSYQRVDEVSCIAFIDSTLGYEALGRGVRAIAFPIRGEAIQADDRRFGWPANLPLTGPFWTSELNETEVMRLVNFVITVSDEEWRRTYFSIIPQLMEFDQGNTRFKKLIDSFL